jgi:Domain of unknown function (DUF4375)
MPYESDPIASKLNEWVSGQQLYWDLDSFDIMSSMEKALIGTWELMNEVYNGGFMQYFHNSRRARATPMVGVLRSFGASQAADVLASAIALAGPGTPLGDEPNYLVAIKAMPGEVRDQLRDLERRLFDCADDTHLQLFRYLSQHRDQIEAPNGFWTETTTQ